MKQSEEMNCQNPIYNVTRCSIGYRLNKILKLKRRFIDQDMQSLNLSRTQWLTLVWIQNLGSSCWQKDLLAKF